MEDLITVLSKIFGDSALLFALGIGYFILYTAIKSGKKDNWESFDGTDKIVFSFLIGIGVYILLIFPITLVNQTLLTLYLNPLNAQALINTYGMIIFEILILGLLLNYKEKTFGILTYVLLAITVLAGIIFVTFLMLSFFLTKELSNYFPALTIAAFFTFIVELSGFFLVLKALEKIKVKTNPFAKIDFPKMWEIKIKLRKLGRSLKNMQWFIIFCLIISVSLCLMIALFGFSKVNFQGSGIESFSRLSDIKEGVYTDNGQAFNVSAYATFQKTYDINNFGLIKWVSISYADVFSEQELRSFIIFNKTNEVIGMPLKDKPSKIPERYIDFGIEEYFINNLTGEIIIRFDRGKIQKLSADKISIFGVKELNLSQDEFSIEVSKAEPSGNNFSANITIKNNLNDSISSNERGGTFTNFPRTLDGCNITKISAIQEGYETDKSEIECDSSGFCQIEGLSQFQGRMFDSRSDENNYFGYEYWHIGHQTKVIMELRIVC